MNKLILTRNMLLIFTWLGISFIYPWLSSGDIVHRSVEDDSVQNKNATIFEQDDCFIGKGSVAVDMKKKPLFIIPSEAIKNISLFYRDCIDTPYVTLTLEVKSSISKELEKFTTNYNKKRVAIFFDEDFVMTAMMSPITRGAFNVGCLPYEKAVAIILNSGFTPNYGETCIGGKTKIIDLTNIYKFKDAFLEKKKYYPSTLDDSEFWHLKENAKMYKKTDEEFIAEIPANKIIEQYYNSELEKFESNKNWIKVVYQEKIGWIERKHVIPFFSLLDTNLFLQKFLIFNEYRYQMLQNHKESYSNYMIGRVNSIRTFYIKEVLSRFKDKKEFQRWYSDVFGKKFE